jgi:hypothetical protein
MCQCVDVESASARAAVRLAFPLSPWLSSTRMRPSILAILCAVGAVASVSWLAGYGRAIWPFVSDGIRDRDLSFLTYPNINVYAHRYFPCWIVSVGAGAAFVASLGGAITMWPHREGRRV